MEIIYIIVFGYIVNLLSLGVLAILAVILTSINMFNPEYMKGILEIEKLSNEIADLRNRLTEKKINPLIQEDFIFLIPFAGVIRTILYLYATVTIGINAFLHNELENHRDKLQAKLDKEK